MVDVLAVLRQEIETNPEGLPYAGKSLQELAEVLNARTRTRQSPRRLSLSEMGALVQPAEYAGVFGHANFVALRDDVDAQRRQDVLSWIGGYHLAGILSAQSAQTLVAYVNGTVGETVSRAEEIGCGDGVTVTASLLASAGIVGA